MTFSLTAKDLTVGQTVVVEIRVGAPRTVEGVIEKVGRRWVTIRERGWLTRFDLLDGQRGENTIGYRSAFYTAEQYAAVIAHRADRETLAKYGFQAQLHVSHETVAAVAALLRQRHEASP